MAMIFTVFEYVLLGILVLVFIVALFVILPVILHFHMHPCKHCGHSMEYKGLKEDGREGHYLFHCPHCGAWQQIPKDEFLRDFMGKECGPNKEYRGYEND